MITYEIRSEFLSLFRLSSVSTISPQHLLYQSTSSQSTLVVVVKVSTIPHSAQGVVERSFVMQCTSKDHINKYGIHSHVFPSRSMKFNVVYCLPSDENVTAAFQLRALSTEVSRRFN